MVFILQLLVSDVQEAKNRKLEPEGKTFHCEKDKKLTLTCFIATQT